MKHKKMDSMLVGGLLVNVFYSATYPFIHKQIISVATDNFIAANQIINCLGIVIFGAIWNKFSDRLFRFYPLFCIFETVFGIATTTFAVTTNQIIAYYILDTLVLAIITRNIICGSIKLRVIRYKTENEREKFDNNFNSVCSIGILIGSVIALFLNLNFAAMLWTATFGNMIDNAIYINIYYKETRINHEKEYNKTRYNPHYDSPLCFFIHDRRVHFYIFT